MAVSALELYPRSSVGLLDAALRLGGRSSGAWLLTLPGSLALCAGLVVWLEAAEKSGSIGGALWILGFAWCLRALGQGAACHHLEQRLLASEPAPPGASVRAALGRAPTLLFTATVLGPLTAAWGVITLGFGLLLWASPQVAYAVAMHRRGPLRQLWREAGSALRASGSLALRVRWLLPFQGLLLINLHVAVQFALSLARSLFGLDVAQLARMASLDNPGWWMLLVVLSFSVMEPIRAAIAVLLLLDARVRREGMDLHARLAALPSSRRPLSSDRPRRAAGVAGRVALVLGILSLSFPAQARTPPAQGQPAQVARLDALVQKCSGKPLGPSTRAALENWTEAGSLTVIRWVDRHEQEAARIGCDRAMKAILRDLAALSAPAPPEPHAAEASAAVREILSRSEFELLPPKAQEAASSSFWDWLMKLLGSWLAQDDEPRAPEIEPERPRSAGSGLGLSQLLSWTLPLIALLAAIWVLSRHARAGGARKERGIPALAQITEAPSEATETALSRPPATWLQLADGLAAEGRHRDAIRSAYLATLAGLHHQGHIRYDPHHSNWDHLMGFRGGRDAQSLFRELTLRFDRAWYGAGNVDAAAWQRVRAHTVRLIGQELVVEAAGA